MSHKACMQFITNGTCNNKTCSYKHLTEQDFKQLTTKQRSSIPKIHYTYSCNTCKQLISDKRKPFTIENVCCDECIYKNKQIYDTQKMCVSFMRDGKCNNQPCLFRHLTETEYNYLSSKNRQKIPKIIHTVECKLCHEKFTTKHKPYELIKSYCMKCCELKENTRLSEHSDMYPNLNILVTYETRIREYRSDVEDDEPLFIEHSYDGEKSYLIPKLFTSDDMYINANGKYQLKENNLFSYLYGGYVIHDSSEISTQNIVSHEINGII